MMIGRCERQMKRNDVTLGEDFIHRCASRWDGWIVGEDWLDERTHFAREGRSNPAETDNTEISRLQTMKIGTGCFMIEDSVVHDRSVKDRKASMRSEEESHRMISDIIGPIIGNIADSDVPSTTCRNIDQVETNTQTSHHPTSRGKAINDFRSDRCVDSNNGHRRWIRHRGEEIGFTINNDQFVERRLQKATFEVEIVKRWSENQNLFLARHRARFTQWMAFTRVLFQPCLISCSLKEQQWISIQMIYR